MEATIRREKLIIPTYGQGAAEELPLFSDLRINQGTRGYIYPYRMSDKLTMVKEDKAYDAIRLENDFIRVTVLPELGGRIYEGYDKVNDYNFVYKNNVIKPALIGLCGVWVSGGIEFNYPQHHRPTTFMPVECTIEEGPNGEKTAWVGEIESMYGIKGTVGVTIWPDRAYIAARVKLYNTTAQTQTFHWWANLAVHANDNYRLMFPPDIDYITFHNKTTVSPFPVVKGMFGGADFGDGVDIRWFKNLRMGSSFFIFDSDYDFMAGYDDGKSMGTVHVADKYVSPGKKFFTWGRAEHGGVWQKNLTDEDGEYLEIMTSCYSDNQPDFAFLLPYETKTFEQRWYSLCGLEQLKNANQEAAVSVTDECVAFNVTAPHSSAILRVTYGEMVVAEQKFENVRPEQCYAVAVKHKADDLHAEVLDENGKLLIEWYKKPMFFDGKKVPDARPDMKTPAQIETNEELWLTGLHLEQYKHPTMDPDPYYLEALRRDPDDIRCNVAYGVVLYRRGRYDEAIPYLERAVDRLTMHNPNPYDGEGLYQLGIVLRQLGRNEKALRMLKRAAWNIQWKAAALEVCAEIECAAGEYGAAMADLDEALAVNARSLKTRALKAALLQKAGKLEEAEEICRRSLEFDPLDPYAAVLTGRTAPFVKVVTGIDAAELFLRAGMKDLALRALELCGQRTVMRCAYAYAATEDEKWLGEARKAPFDEVFPNREMDFTVLEKLEAADEANAAAPYLLGCMHYARYNGEKALEKWLESIHRKPDFGAAHRCAALALSEKFGDNAGALKQMETAFALTGTPRMLYELCCLYRAMGRSAQDCLMLLEKHRELIETREDMTLLYISLLNEAGRLEDAQALLGSHRFYTYEGGEGVLPREHAYTYLTLGRRALEKGDGVQALELFKRAMEYPENYHEGRRFGPRQAHICWYIAEAYRALGDEKARMEWLREAAVQSGDFAESDFYRAQALRALGRDEEAAKLLRAMEAHGREQCARTQLAFFDGFPTPAPFAATHEVILKSRGMTALAMALKGMGKDAQAAEMALKMKEAGFDAVWVEFVL